MVGFNEFCGDVFHPMWIASDSGELALSRAPLHVLRREPTGRTFSNQHAVAAVRLAHHIVPCSIQVTERIFGDHFIQYTVCQNKTFTFPVTIALVTELRTNTAGVLGEPLSFRNGWVILTIPIVLPLAGIVGALILRENAVTLLVLTASAVQVFLVTAHSFREGKYPHPKKAMP